MVAEQTFQQLNLPHIVQEQRALALRRSDNARIATYETIWLPYSANPVEQFTQGRMSYQLRRLRLDSKGFPKVIATALAPRPQCSAPAREFSVLVLAWCC